MALSKEMGTSRGPVREAINRLVSEGLVEQVPNAKPLVHKPDRTDLEDLYQLRQWLEGEAAAEAARRIDEPHLAELERICNEMRAIAHEHRHSGRRFAEGDLLYRHATTDLSFHVTLIRASGNRRVMKVIADHHAMSQVWCFLQEQHDLRSLARLYREHARIMRAVRRGDAEAARGHMQEHIDLGRQKALDRYDWRQRQLAASKQTESSWPASLGETLRRMEREQANGEMEREQSEETSGGRKTASS